MELGVENETGVMVEKPGKTRGLTDSPLWFSLAGMAALGWMLTGVSIPPPCSVVSPASLGFTGKHPLRG